MRIGALSGACLVSVCLFVILSPHLPAAVSQDKYQQRAAWTLENSVLRLTMMQAGGHIAAIILKGENEVNPLWLQSRKTIDADTYAAARDEATYGGGSGARLMSGLLGHNLCFPFWGNPSETEAKAGMTFHGETGIVRWRQVSQANDSLTATADLPESGTSLTRSVRLKGQVAEFEEIAQNLKAWDRPVGWCEHVTMGAPFLDKGVTEIEASLTRGLNDGTAGELRWPNGMAEKSVDLRKVRNLKQSAGFVNHFLVDPAREYGFFTAFHPRYRLVFGYIFPRTEFPWLNIWESNTPEMLTRGMEFSNTPVHGTLKALMKTPQLWDVPTFNWLDAKSKLRKHYWAFSLRVPENFKGVASVQRRNQQVVVTEKGSSKEFIVP